MTQASLKTRQMQVDGMDCGNCAKAIEVSLRQLAGVSEAQVSFATACLQVSYDPVQTSETASRDRPGTDSAVAIRSALNILGVSRSGAAGDRLPLCPGHFYTCFYRQLTTLAFDKTGTITQGQPAVQKVYNLS